MTEDVKVNESADATFPLSFQQEQVWFFQRFAPDGVAHHAQATIRVVGTFDPERFDRVLTEIHRRHEILRTTYSEFGGRPRQLVHPAEPVRAARIDISDAGEGQHELLGEIVSREAREPFAAHRLPLIRWTVARLSEQEHEIVVVQNHLLHDRWSFSLLMREVTALYNAFAEGAANPLTEPPLQYRDLAVRQRSSLATAPLQAQLAYWQKQLNDLPPRLELQADRPRPTVQSFRGEILRVDLPPELATGLRSFCRAHRVTLFSTMLAAFSTCLSRHTGQRDFHVGSQFAGRQAPQTGNLIGALENTVLLRCEIDLTEGFTDLVGKTHGLVLDATANELLPFSELVRVLNPAREPGRNPLTDVLFSVDESPFPDLDLDGATATITEHGNGAAKADLNVVVTPGSAGQEGEHTDGSISMLWEYAVDLFDGMTVSRLAETYLRLLADAIARPTAPLFTLAVISPEDRARMLDDWNPERRDRADGGPLVHHTVREQARKRPDAPAIRDGDREVSYAELISRADSLAGVLLAGGVLPGSVVGLCLPRGADLVIAELAVLCAGAAYLPLDPENPPTRLAGQYAAAGAVLVVTDSVIADRLPSDLARLLMDRLPEVVDAVDAGPPSRVTQADLAYLIATSGSTGQPKIVMVEHGSLSNVVAWRRRRCDLGPSDRVAQIASPGFDPSVTDIWPTLTAGAILYVPDQDTKLDPERLRSWLTDVGITVTELPTALAERVLALDWPPRPALRTLIIGGDRLRVRPAADLSFQVLNEYGPTETTATATAGHIEPAGTSHGPPDIGRPIAGTSVYILDAWRQLVPPGTTGELWIGGAGVARGYHGSASLTADRFVADPFSGIPGSRMYRTGDLARHLPSGKIDFIGRRDRQIKLRGYRIEPVEIVEALRAHPAVTDAVVLARTPEQGTGEKRLVAYVEAENRPELPHELREHLAGRVPRYMIPTDLVLLDSLPINRNGKVDEKALPLPGPAQLDQDFVPPQTDTQRWLAETWCAVLRVERASLDDSFFEIGGHSLLLFEVQRALAARGHDLSIVTFFEYTTIRRLAMHLEERGNGGGAERSEQAERRNGGRARLDRRRATLRSAGRTEL